MYRPEGVLFIVNFLRHNKNVTLGDLYREYLRAYYDKFVGKINEDLDVETYYQCHQGNMFKNAIEALKQEKIVIIEKNNTPLDIDSAQCLDRPVSIDNKKMNKIQSLFGFKVTELLESQLSAKTLKVSPLFGTPTKHVTDVFVIMPFSKVFKTIYVNHIQKVCASLSLNCMRADDIFSSKPVMNDIWSLIYNAKIIICDCTMRNPNVFYELGIAHTVGKEVILLTQNAKDIPFDVRHLRYIKYNYTLKGMLEFEGSLKRFIENAK